jgi:hypothetical protein
MWKSGEAYAYLFVGNADKWVLHFALDKGHDGVRFQQALAELLVR